MFYFLQNLSIIQFATATYFNYILSIKVVFLIPLSFFVYYIYIYIFPFSCIFSYIHTHTYTFVLSRSLFLSLSPIIHVIPLIAHTHIYTSSVFFFAKT